MRRLAANVLPSLPVQQPQYDREQTKAGIVHLGIGAFHRGHQAYYTERLLNQKGGDWAIIGASLRSARIRDQLQPQDWLYTLVEQDTEHSRFSIIGAIKEVLVGPENPNRLITVMSDPCIKVITLTITEKGYCHDPAAGEIDWSHPDVQHDLRYYLTSPLSAIGYLVAALAQRKNLQAPVTLLSCDNLSHNGRLLQRVVTSFARRVDPALADWITQFVAFPCSMVDRIVPAATQAQRLLAAEVLGVEDQSIIVTEPFSQWVIENRFAAEMPDWASQGATVVDNVTPYEEIKLKLLNGSHSLIAYLGYVAGYDYVHEAIADSQIAKQVQRYMDLVTATLSIPDGFEIEGYKQLLLQRFANSALNHRTDQIAQDGSYKIAQRWLGSLRQLLGEGRDVSPLAFALACWVRFLSGFRESGESYDIIDPLKDALLETLKEAKTKGESPVAAVLSIQAVFADLVKEWPQIIDSVDLYYKQLLSDGLASVND